MVGYISYCWLHIPVCFHAFPEFIIVSTRSAKTFTPQSNFTPQIPRSTQIHNQIVVAPQIPNTQIVNLQPKTKYHQPN